MSRQASVYGSTLTVATTRIPPIALLATPTDLMGIAVGVDFRSTTVLAILATTMADATTGVEEDAMAIIEDTTAVITDVIMGDTEEVAEGAAVDAKI